MIPAPNLTNRLSLEGFSASFDKGEIRQLLGILQERLNAAAEIEVSSFEKLGQSDEEFEKNKGILRDGFRLRPTVLGHNGQELFGFVDEVFSSPNFPDAVKSIYVNSAIFLRAVHNYNVRNSFEMFLDFSRPEIFDFNLMPSFGTPNGSNIKANGTDPTWVNGLFHEVRRFVTDHAAVAPWIHKHSVYDILLWFIGYPVAFWTCYKAAPFLPSPSGVGPFLRAALYVYLFLIVLVSFRALFHYGRWAFPRLEYRYPKDRALQHRIALGALSLSLVGSLIYDVLKGISGP